MTAQLRFRGYRRCRDFRARSHAITRVERELAVTAEQGREVARAVGEDPKDRTFRRVFEQLVDDGQIVATGDGYVPADASADTPEEGGKTPDATFCHPAPGRVAPTPPLKGVGHATPFCHPDDGGGER